MYYAQHRRLTILAALELAQSLLSCDEREQRKVAARWLYQNSDIVLADVEDCIEDALDAAHALTKLDNRLAEKT